MLRRSLQHLPGIRERLEQRLWARGVRCWDDLDGFTPPRVDENGFRRAVAESGKALRAGDVRWFADRMPSRESWRLYREYGAHAAYLDIETTGATRGADSITCIAVAAAGGVRTFVRGRNLDDFPSSVRDASILVTFNGSAFDLPFLDDAFPQLQIRTMPHFDVCTALRRLKMRGGLKKLERELGVPRDEGLDGADGWIAVDLWRRHHAGDSRALPTLERYCAEDVLGLPALATLACNRLLQSTPFRDELAAEIVPRRIACFRPYSRELVEELVAARENALRERERPREDLF